MINNRSRIIGNIPLGRPVRQQINQQQTIQTEGNEQIWFFDDYLVQIISFLANKGSLLFKSEGGKKAAARIRNLREQKIQEREIKSIKKYRKDKLLPALQAYQMKILKQLGYSQNKEFLLLADGQSQNMYINIGQGNKLNLIIKLLDPCFIDSFECFVNNKVINLSETKHKMLLDWGTIMVLTKQGRDILDDFKNIRNLQDIVNIRQKVDKYLVLINGNTQINLEVEQFQKEVDAFLQKFYYKICTYLIEPNPHI